MTFIKANNLVVDFKQNKLKLPGASGVDLFYNRNECKATELEKAERQHRLLPQERTHLDEVPRVQDLNTQTD